VNRHLTSARSDILANRQIDVWEIAWVWAYPVKDKAEIGDRASPPDPSQKVRTMAGAEIAEKRDPALRLPRHAEHCSRIVGHFLAVKNSGEIVGAIQAHFERRQKCHLRLLGLAIEVESDAGDD
jgi:hypothetical protein